MNKRPQRVLETLNFDKRKCRHSLDAENGVQKLLYLFGKAEEVFSFKKF